MYDTAKRPLTGVVEARRFLLKRVESMMLVEGKLGQPKKIEYDLTILV